MTRVIIKASDVAAIVGKNKFKPVEEVFNELWKKYSPENFNSKTKLDLAEEALNKSDAAKDIFRETSAKRAKTSTEAQDNFKEAEAKIKTDTTLSEEEKKRVIEHVRSKVYTEHGINKEDETARRTGLDLKRDETFYKLHIGEFNDREYVVVGRVDRIETLPDGSQILVEIKNRTKKLFHQVYPSEMVQLQVYLEMLNLDKAKLVEQYNSQVNTMMVDRDREMFEEIFKGLEDFCFRLSQVML